MAPTSTTTKTQTQLGFDSSTSYMRREHSTIWAIASLDTFTVVFVLLDWVFMAKKCKHKTHSSIHTSKVSTCTYTLHLVHTYAITPQYWVPGTYLVNIAHTSTTHLYDKWQETCACIYIYIGSETSATSKCNGNRKNMFQMCRKYN